MQGWYPGSGQPRYHPNVSFITIPGYDRIPEPGYWKESCSRQEIEDWWIFGQNGQADLWLSDKHGCVYFYNHDLEEMCPCNFTRLGIDFAGWLQLADPNSQLDGLYDREEEYFGKKSLTPVYAGSHYKEILGKIGPELLMNDPFDI